MIYSVGKYRYLLFFTLFLAPNVISFLRIDSNIYYSMLMTVSGALAFCNRRTVSKELIWLILFTILYGSYKIYTDTGEGTRAIVLRAMAPAILFAAYPPVNVLNPKNLRLWRALAAMLLVFYLLETGIAVYERLTWHLVFGWIPEQTIGGDMTMTHFRSTALLGHPLANALIVSVLMSFFLISPFKQKYKYLLWFIGFIAVLCFNARGATIGNVVIFCVYFLYTQFYSKKHPYKHKMRSLMFVAVLAGIACYLIMNGYIGGRLIENDLDDGSAQVRIDIWRVFSKYDVKTFLFGVSHNNLDMIMFSLGLYATENYWLDWVFRLGLFFLLPYVLLYGKVIRAEYLGYSKIDMFLTLITFLGISSTNNSLSTSILPTFVFLICIRIFKRQYIYHLFPKKMFD